MHHVILFTLPSIILFNCILINYAKHIFRFADQPQVPPLTPGTNKKLTEVLNASFASWEKEVQSYKITKGKLLTAAVVLVIILSAI